MGYISLGHLGGMAHKMDIVMCGCDQSSIKSDNFRVLGLSLN